ERGYLGVRGRGLAAVELLGDALLRVRPGSRELAPSPSERAIAAARVPVTLVRGVRTQGGAADPSRGAELVAYAAVGAVELRRCGGRRLCGEKPSPRAQSGSDRPTAALP